MQKRNLTKEKIIQVAFSLADEIGLNQVTFPKIAEKLGIKYPSLYNHFANMNDLKIEMTVYFLNGLHFELMQGLVGKSGKDAIKEFAYIYRDFAFKNKSGYELFMNIPNAQDEKLNHLAKEIYKITHKILKFYIEDEKYSIHKNRALRSFLHGFISLNFLGYFQGPVDLEDSFQVMIDDFILSISKI